MKFTLILFITLVSLHSHAGRLFYPKSPDPELTPGSLCKEPSEYRYPEQIAYCERSVNFFMKEAIFVSYRKVRGYTLSGDRADYKIDHFIPLCLGGSNEQNNLWPQHISISKISDPLEALGCEKLSDGKISQKDLIQLIVKVKLNLEEAPKVLKYLRSLR